MDDARVIPTSLDDLFNAIFLAKCLGPYDILYSDAVFRSDTLEVVADLVAQRLSELGEIAESDALSTQPKSHTIAVAPVRNCAHNNKAG